MERKIRFTSSGFPMNSRGIDRNAAIAPRRGAPPFWFRCLTYKMPRGYDPPYVEGESRWVAPTVIAESALPGSSMAFEMPTLASFSV